MLPPGIEPGSPVPQTSILSVKLREQYLFRCVASIGYFFVYAMVKNRHVRELFEKVVPGALLRQDD